MALTAAHLPFAPVVMEFWNLVVPSGFNRRTREFQEEVAKTIKELVDRFGKLPEELEKDDRFLDAVARASVAAMKDHRREKWELLHNALMNAALPGAFDEDVQGHFFQLVDELGVTHVAILKTISKPQAMPTGYRGPQDLPDGGRESPIFSFLRERLGKTKADEQNLRLFVDELVVRGLLPKTWLLPWLGLENLTPTGRRFLAFVSSPPPPNAE